jgi:ankyrin repeat protein
MADLDKYNSLLLLDAVRSGHTSITKLLVNAGCNVHAVGSYGGTLLHYAAILTWKNH